MGFVAISGTALVLTCALAGGDAMAIPPTTPDSTAPRAQPPPPGAFDADVRATGFNFEFSALNFSVRRVKRGDYFDTSFKGSIVVIRKMHDGAAVASQQKQDVALSFWGGGPMNDETKRMVADCTQMAVALAASPNESRRRLFIEILAPQNRTFQYQVRKNEVWMNGSDEHPNPFIMACTLR
jgi:hypothetical protein